VDKLTISVYGEVCIKLFKEPKTGNCKNVFIYFDKGYANPKSLKENQNSEACHKLLLGIELVVIIKYL